MSDDGERRLFSPLFPFVRPLVTDSNLSFDANNICPICSCLRRKKKEEEFQNEEKGKEKKDMKKIMDIVQIYICLYGNAFHLMIGERKQKKNENMSSIGTRIEHNTVAESFLSSFIHHISQKYMHSNNSVVFFSYYPVLHEGSHRERHYKCVFFSFALFYSTVNSFHR
jgi:hypothetical protein